MSNYPRFELIHVTYDDGDTAVHLVRIENDWLDDGNSEFIEADMIMNHSDVLAMFSEEFRWKMSKMTWEEWETYRESLR